MYSHHCENSPEDTIVIVQRTQRLTDSDSLFYSTVLVQGLVELNAMVDSGSMACTISAEAEQKLLSAGAINFSAMNPSSVVLIGCGGQKVKPECAYELELTMFECKMLVPVLVVSRQQDEMIVGTNVLKHLLHHLKKSGNYWDLLSNPDESRGKETEMFLDLLANLQRWKGDKIPNKIGTVKLRQCVTLLPRHEHLIWGKLPNAVSISVGSTVMVEPTTSKAAQRNVLVGRLVTPLWGDRWIPMRVINPLDKPIVIKRNAKIADVHACIALEDFEPICNRPHVTLKQSYLQNAYHSQECAKLSTPSREQSQSVGSRKQTNHYSYVDTSLKKLDLEDLDIATCEVSDHWKQRLVDLVSRYEQIFSRGKLDCGEAARFVHRIRLTDDRPFRLPYRRVPPAHYHKLKQVLDEMEEKGIISKSTSEWASPLVLVWKPSGDLRICTDFRWLNARTIKDAHPLPHQADALASLGGNSLYSTMDLTSGFYNIPIHEDDRKYTACTTPVGLYEYNRMAQGLCNSPATFSRMMISIFGDQNYLSLLCYLDDLLVFGKSEEEALNRLEMVFIRLRDHNLKLSPKKCHFFKKTVKFLGHIVSEEGISTDPDKVSAIEAITSEDLMEADGRTPSMKKIRSFLGLANYYSHFVPGFSTMARPLYKLTAEPRQGKRPGGQVKLRKPVLRKLRPEEWTEDCQKALEDLKAVFLETVVLAHPDFTKPFILATDASQDGLGAVLSQVPEGEEKARPVAFASKALTRSQTRYPAHRLEFLALKWAVCDKFGHWLKGHRFTAWTDNNPLTYIMTKPKLDACEQRWVAKLAPYDFDLRYVPGTRNVPADVLSRQPFTNLKVSRRLVKEPYKALLAEANGVPKDSVQGTFLSSVNCQAAENCKMCDQENCCGNRVSPDLSKPVSLMSEDVKAVLDTHLNWEKHVPARAVYATQHVQNLLPAGQPTFPVFTLQRLQEQQQADVDIGRIIFYVQRGRRPSRRELEHESSQTKRLLKQWEKLELKNGILYRISKGPSGVKRYQLVVPTPLKKEVLKGVHDDAGHQGQERTLYLTRQRFFWLGLEEEVKSYVRHCKRCVVSKTPEPEARAPLESIKTTEPLELLCIDFWSAEDNKNNKVDVLVVTDHFTKLAHAFPCQNQTAKQVAKKLWDSFFCIYGFPRRLHSDQGTSFESKLISELLEMAGVQKSHTTPYHAMGNGQTERYNRTLGSMLRALPPREKGKWPQMVQTLTFCYNCTAHETTGYPPFYLMFGRIPRLPVDLMFRSVLRDRDVVDYDDFVTSLERDLQEAMKTAQKHASKEQRKQAGQYNKKIKGTRINIGDHVLLANRGERGKRKLADIWASTVYKVIDINQDIHTYKIQNPATNQVKVVHRNLLLPANFLPLEPEQEDMWSVWSILSNDETEIEEVRPEAIEDLEKENQTSRTLFWILQSPSGENREAVKPTEKNVERENIDVLNDHEDVDEVQSVGRVSYQKSEMSRIDDHREPDVSRVETEAEISSQARTLTNKRKELISGSSTRQSGSECNQISVTGACTYSSRSVASRKTQSSKKSALKSVVVPDTEDSCVSGGPYKTRYGRTIKPVERLICAMNMLISHTEDKEPLAAVFDALVKFIIV